MINKLLETDGNRYTLAILRIILGVVIFAHGVQKLFGVWGGHGIEWTIRAWNQWWGIPSVFTVIVIIVESLGAICLILGLFTRIWSFLIGIIMLVAIWLVHAQWGFYMNWYIQPQTGEGFEYHILVLVIVIVLLLEGGGKFSLDNFLSLKLLNRNK